MKAKTTQLLDDLYLEAKALNGISLSEEPIRFDVAAPIISEWKELDRERLTSLNDKRDTHKFLQSVISVADIQVPYDRKETKQIFETGISFVSVLFARNSNGDPTIMLRAYIPTETRFFDFERLTTVLSKTYCPNKGISWENLCDNIKTLGITDEFHMIVEEFKKTIHEVKSREELETKVHKTFRLV